MISEEVEAIRQTFRVTCSLLGLAFGLTYWLADHIGFNNPLQAGMVVLLVCLTMLALGILLMVLAQRFCDVLEVEQPQRSTPTTTPRRATGIFANARRNDSGLDMYLHRIYREVAPGDRSYIRKGSLHPNRSQTGPLRPATAPVNNSAIGGLQRAVLSPRTEPYRTSTIQHPKPHREPRN